MVLLNTDYTMMVAINSFRHLSPRPLPHHIEHDRNDAWKEKIFRVQGGRNAVYRTR